MGKYYGRSSGRKGSINRRPKKDVIPTSSRIHSTIENPGLGRELSVKRASLTSAQRMREALKKTRQSMPNVVKLSGAFADKARKQGIKIGRTQSTEISRLKNKNLRSNNSEIIVTGVPIGKTSIFRTKEEADKGIYITLEEAGRRQAEQKPGDNVPDGSSPGGNINLLLLVGVALAVAVLK